MEIPVPALRHGRDGLLFQAVGHLVLPQGGGEELPVQLPAAAHRREDQHPRGHLPLGKEHRHQGVHIGLGVVLMLGHGLGHPLVGRGGHRQAQAGQLLFQLPVAEGLGLSRGQAQPQYRRAQPPRLLHPQAPEPVDGVLRRELEQSCVQGSRLVRLLLRLRVLPPVKQLLLRFFLFFALLGLAAEETEQDRIFERHTFQHLLFFSGRLMGAMGKRSLLQLEAVLEPHAAVEDQVLRGTVPAVRAEVAHTHELEPIAGGGVLQARLQLAAGDHLQGIGVEAV